MLEVGALADRYLLGRRLGEGSFGEVYEALDPGRGERVALKLLKRSSPGAIARFKREFRALRDLIHPNLIALYELGAVDPLWFFTMELVDGVDLSRWLGRGGEAPPTVGTGDDEVAAAPVGGPALDLARVASVLGQLADGLDVVHAAGRLHCDLKPNNVLVDRAGRVRLCDFGQVADVGERADRGGTAWFMAPEQVANERLTPASDWYAVGVMLYETVSGRLPFAGGAEAVRAGKLAGPAPSVASLARGAPQPLVALIDALLARAPGDRAGAPEVRAVARALGADPSATSSGGRAVGREPALIGRERELSVLAEAWRRARTSTVIVRVLGPSGIGKSALCRELLAGLPPETLVLEGRCYEREQMPFRALDPIVDELVRWLAGLSEGLRAELLPPEAGFLGRLFPVLRSITGAVDEQAPGEARRRGFAVARALIARIARHTPLVIWLDDLQWSDPGSGEMLAEILRQPEGPPLLCLASCRSEDAPASEVLAALEAAGLETTELTVPSLAPEDGAALARALGGADADAGAIAAEASGSPFLVRELALAGAMRRRGRITVDDVVRDRVAGLPPRCRALLSVVALAGRPIAEPTATAAASSSGDAVGLAEVAQLRAAGLLRATAASRAIADELDTYHDRVREAVVAGLDGDARIPIHRSLAAALVTAGGDLEVIALHHRGAGDRVAARQAALVAAEAASAAGTAERAAALFALAADQADDPNDRQTLELARGEQLAIAGQGSSAAAVFAAAAATTTGDDARRLRRRSAELLLRSGDVDDGLAALLAVLREHGLRVPSTPRGALASLVWQRARLAVRGTGFREQARSDLSPRTLERIDALWAAATCLSMSDHLRGADFQARNLRAALDAGEPTRVSRALALEAIYSATAGGRGRERSRQLIARATELVTQTGDPMARAMTILAEGVRAHQAGEWVAARDQCAAAMTALAAAPHTFYELANARFFWLETLVYLGDMEALAVAVPQFLDDANRRGDAYTLRYLRGGPASFRWIWSDQPGRALAEVREVAAGLPSGVFHIQHLVGMLAETQALLATGDGAAAHDRIERDWRALDSSQLLRAQNVLIEMTALRGRAALASGDRVAAQRCARQIRGERMPWGDALAALLDAALDPRGGAAWRAAADACDACAMRLYADAARARAGDVARVPAAVIAALAPV